MIQQRLVKTGGRLVKHPRYYWLLLAESHLTRRLFGAMVRRIEALPWPAGLGEPPTERISATREARTGASVAVIGRKTASFEPLGPSGEQTDPSRRPLKHGEPQTQLTVVFSGGQACVNRRSRVENGSRG